MTDFHLFLVQDDERPMYVVAPDWTAALALWRAQIIAENGPEGDDPKPEPTGIQRLTDGTGTGGEFPELLL